MIAIRQNGNKNLGQTFDLVAKHPTNSLCPFLSSSPSLAQTEISSPEAKIFTSTIEPNLAALRSRGRTFRRGREEQ